MVKITKLITIIMILAISQNYTVFAQVAINTDGSNAEASAMLDVKSTDKGMLIPRMTQLEIAAVTNPANGLTVYNTDDCLFYVYRDCTSNWVEIALGSSTILPVLPCGNPLIDTRDGKTYATVQIGTQCWMAENLNLGTKVNGTVDQTDNTIFEKYCYHDNITKCDIYGGLYQWDEMMQYVTTEGSQGICPSGWHLPSSNEFCTLEDFVDVGAIVCNSGVWRGIDAGGNLKETGFTHWAHPNTGATNSSGFTSVPAGFRYISGNFVNLSNFSNFWSSTEDGADAWAMYLKKDSAQAGRSTDSKTIGFSVRCIQD